MCLCVYTYLPSHPIPVILVFLQVQHETCTEVDKTNAACVFLPLALLVCAYTYLYRNTNNRSTRADSVIGTRADSVIDTHVNMHTRHLKQQRINKIIQQQL